MNKWKCDRFKRNQSYETRFFSLSLILCGCFALFFDIQVLTVMVHGFRSRMKKLYVTLFTHCIRSTAACYILIYITATSRRHNIIDPSDAFVTVDDSWMIAVSAKESDACRMAGTVVNVRLVNTQTSAFIFENRGNEWNSLRISWRVEIETISNGSIELYIFDIWSFEHFSFRSHDQSARKWGKMPLWMVQEIVEWVFLCKSLFIEHEEKTSETVCVYKIRPGRWVYKWWRLYVYRNIWENVLKWN